VQATPDLFGPITLGPHQLRNRLVMAPMTRNRAGEGLAPTGLSVEYYTQRASAGLIITEATQVSPQGIGYPNTPGIYTAQQVAAWRWVTESVHMRGGLIYLQLWHVGRVSDLSLQPGGSLPIGPSAIAARGMHYTPTGPRPYAAPRAVATNEIPGLVEQFQSGARLALLAGFDGVEIHGANGYLLDQFLEDGSNRREDRFGGSIENRARFPLEVAAAVAEVWGADRVGYRVSPLSDYNGMHDSDPAITFAYLAEALSRMGVGYLHVRDVAPTMPGTTVSVTRYMREHFAGRVITNGGLDRIRAETLLAAGDADMAAFGTLFLANPDLPRRLATGAPLNAADPDTFYSGGPRGYVDYPA
jgi:N-ethylmaleimide reductase